MFPMAMLVHGGLERAADRYGDRTASTASATRSPGTWWTAVSVGAIALP
jgi:hypothetical protein